MKAKHFFFTTIIFLTTVTKMFPQQSLEERYDEIEKRLQKQESILHSLSKLKVSGYIQTQYQHGEKDASLKVGSKNENPEESFNRIGIRRGRIKFAYEEGIASAVFQLDITEKGVNFKDAYLNVKDPWVKTNSLRAGVFDRPFGYEIGYSSSRRESPERSTVFQTLFPDERDLGAMLILQPAKTSPLNFLKLEAGLFAGNGIYQETDNHKDFIGHLSASQNIGKNTTYGLGVSYYNGGVHQTNENVYKMEGNSFVLDASESNIGKFAKREYIGFDGRISYKSLWGLTQLRAEYLFGQQPGSRSSHKSPSGSSLPSGDTYIRKFNGGYVIFIQDIGKSPFAAVIKYDWYDPNTKVSKDEVGINGTGKADLSQNTWGIGALWHATSNLRLQAYYEFNNYEKTEHIEKLEANVFTVRLQYKF